ncbi:MAG: hypothetical protein WD995_04525 [Gemmatimonadota bacterium]
MTTPDSIRESVSEVGAELPTLQEELSALGIRGPLVDAAPVPVRPGR